MQNPTSTPDSGQDSTPIRGQCPIKDRGNESTSKYAVREPFLVYESTSGASDPTVGTVTQPGVISADPPENLKARLKDSYDSIAPSYNQWTLMHRGHRADYTVKLINLLREERARRDEARGTKIAEHAEYAGPTGYTGHLEHPQHMKHAEDVKVASVAKGTEDPREADITSVTSVSEITGYAAGRGRGVVDGDHSTKDDSHTRGEPSLLAEAGIHVVRLNDMRALEVGCGDGIPVTEILLAEELNVTGVDMSATQIALCQAHFPNQAAAGQAAWAQRDMMDVEYPEGEFDAIVALYTLLHLPREEQMVFLVRARRWLKPGGLLLFNFPQAENGGEVEEHWLGLEKGWVYRSSWGEEKMLRFIEGLEGMKVLVKEVTEANNPDPKFVWVIAKKSV
ncbi:S-adenosyl-L-methionine-dependent methyltransferase [Chaetomium sp. MPI-CAGE-AT-0009]|nr:S-adenosyl-L-methionine-dependent methyltransferase [Chaetomium sp. MPI-CAGE-AT-0009]